MKVSCFGAGYVGLVSSACFASAGHHVLCMDADEKKIAALGEGMVPLYEPGLEALVDAALSSRNLHFSHDTAEAIHFAQILFIAVGTPPDEDGSADLQHVLQVATRIGQEMRSPKVVVTKSTVPVGTAERIRDCIQRELDARDSTLSFDVASNPEFLKEGSAVTDFMSPDRFLIGTDSDEVKHLMQELYEPFNRKSDRMIFMDIRAAELSKYAANAMLATKISFMNEIANLAELLGTDIEQVRHGIGSDSRIGYQFIYPGIGYGGSCFPKDIRALSHTAAQLGRQMRILNAVEAVNTAQKSRLVELIIRHYSGNVRGKTFALWGLSFKPKTDDIREAPSRVIMEALWEAGASIQAYDPEAMNEVERHYGHRDDLRLIGTRDAALLGADALIICTEWQHFRAVDFDNLCQHLGDKVIFDGRNLYDPHRLEAKGLQYYGIGRGASVRAPLPKGL